VNDYQAFLDSKAIIVRPTGRDVDPSAIHPSLFPFQRDLTRWSLRKGRAALFCDTGTGKTREQLEFARLTGERTLIFAPLSVVHQTIGEAAAIGIPVVYARSQAEATPTGITITNYERLKDFDLGAFGTVVLDESSCLKDHAAKTRTRLIEACRDVPYRLACTATPAPNDIAEIANHAEFLGVMSRAEMLASFFVHDDAGWRLRGHAREPFYRWLASWAMTMRLPSDLGYSDEGYILPALAIETHFVATTYVPAGQLFFTGLKGITDRARVRSSTIAERVDRVAQLVQAEPAEPWLIWCGLNAEQDAIAATLGAACISIDGSLSPEEKVRRETCWRSGQVPYLATKPSVFGWGMNWQHCARMAFLGLSDSYEAIYQAIRRCWRFGQTRLVAAHVVLSDVEDAIWANVQRKQREAEQMSAELVQHVAGFERAEIVQVAAREDWPHAQTIRLPAWLKEIA
jgi:hypothetical protein